MKKYLTLIAAAAALGAQAQTMNVNTGSVCYAFNEAQTGTMTFTGGTQLTVQGKTFEISDIESIDFATEEVADNSVSVAYNGTSAAVVIAGNLAQYATVSVSGADVSIVMDESLEEEVTYTLSGTSTDGSFYMDGEYKAAVVLNGLSLANADGAAIDIRNGKRIDIDVEGTNTLSDGAGDQKACFNVQGHAEFAGSGTLTITGNYKHGYRSHEYTTLKKSFTGSFVVDGAASDGLHIEQYFKMNGGTLTVSGVSGDGIDVAATDDTSDEDNGQIFINDGTINVSVTAQGVKGIKCDSALTMTGGAVTVTSSGSAYYDSDEADISSCSVVKPGTDFLMSGGTMTLTNTGSGGKGLNAGGDATVSGGVIYVTTTGSVFEYGDDDTKAQAFKADGNITISGGEAYVCAGPDSKAFKTDNTFAITGGKLMGVGSKKSEPTVYTQDYSTYKGISVSGGQTLSYDGVSYTVPSIYSMSSAKILVSGGE